MRVGIIGFEHMHATSYASALRRIPGVELAGIAEADEFRGTQMAARFSTRHFRDPRDLLDTDIQGVVVCTSNVGHRDAVIEAAERGRHVLVEKPFATRAEDAEAMLSACGKHGVNLMTAFPLRFNQSVIQAKRTVEAGGIGEIRCITGVNHGKIPSGWFLDKARSGGGAVLDHTVHVADLMRWFTGSEPTAVYAESGELIHGRGIDDCGLLHVEFDNGVFATIDTSWAHHDNYPIWPEVYLRLVGTRGVLTVDAFRQTFRLFAPKDGAVSDVYWGSDGDLGLVREFVSSMREGRKPHPDGKDGERAMAVALAAYRSSETHGKEAV